MTDEERKTGYEDIQPFIRYDLDGRIIGEGTQGVLFTQDAARKGDFIMPGEGGRATHYVDLEGDATLKRPKLKSFSRTTLTVGKTAKLKDLPPCTVTWTGRLTGSEEHPGGDYEIGWTIAGSYTVSIETFPFLATEVAFTVSN